MLAVVAQVQGKIPPEAQSSRRGEMKNAKPRIQNAKFKNMVRPGDELLMEVELTESLANAHYMKGTTKVAGKTVLVIEFTVASV